MAHQCELKKSYYRNWVKAVLAFKRLKGCFGNIAEKSVWETHDEIQSQNRKKRFEIRDGSSCKVTCLPRTTNISPKHLEKKISKTHPHTLTTFRQNSSTIGHDTFCRVRQLRNTLVHSSTMELDENAYEQFIYSVLSMLGEAEFKENDKIQQAIKTINQLKQEDYGVTLLDEIAAYGIAKESVDERTNEIKEEIDDIIEFDIIHEKTGLQKHNILGAFVCPLIEKNNSQLQNLKRKVDVLLTRTQSLDVTDTETGKHIREIRALLTYIEIELESLENMLSLIHRSQMWLIKSTQYERCPDRSSDNFLPDMNQAAYNPENYLGESGCHYTVTAEDRDKVLLKERRNTHVAYRGENNSQKIEQLSQISTNFSQRCISEDKPTDIGPFILPSLCSLVYRQSAQLKKAACFRYIGNVSSNEKTSLPSRDRPKPFNVLYAFDECSCAQKTCKKMEIVYSDTYHISKWQSNPLIKYSRKSMLPFLRKYGPQACFLKGDEILKHKQSLLFPHSILTPYEKTSETEPDVDLKDAFKLDRVLIANECLLDILSSPNSCGYLELEFEDIKNLYIYALNSNVIISVKIFLAWLKRSTFRSIENRTVDKANCSILFNPEQENNLHCCIFLCYLLFLKRSLNSSCLKSTDNNPDFSRNIQDIRSDNGPEVSLHAPANTNDTHEHNSSSQEMREGSNTHHSDENISLVQHSKPKCQLVYGTVDLKSQRSSHDSEQQDDSLKKDDEKSDLIKNVICDGLAYANVNTEIITAPAFTNQRKNKKPSEKSKRDQTDVTSSGAGFAEHEKSEDNNNAVSSTVDNVSALNEQVSEIPNEVSADGHPPSRASGYTGLDEKSPRKNNVQSQIEHGNQIDCALSIPLPHKDSSVPRAACGAEGSSSYSTGQSPVIQPIDLPNPEVDQADIQRFEPLMQIIDKIADGERVPPQITMRYEMLRFCTLRSYPKENKPYITRLAQAGFYYANSGDEVVCYSCARRKSNWREDDIPMDIHRQLNPNCNFLLRNSEVNVPIRVSDSFFQNSTRSTSHQNLQNGNCTDTTPNAFPQNTLKHSLQTTIQTSSQSSNTFQRTVQNNTGLVSSSSIDTVPSNRMHSRAHGNFVQTVETSSLSLERQSHHATVSSSTFDPSSDGSSTPALQNTTEGANRSSTPKYPKYASKTVRVTSFNDCGDIVIPPDSLADSGFFYAGFGDCVRCFQCGVGLRHWSEEDDPWIEHSRWSKDCAFVRQMRGQEFVNLVQMAVQYSQNQNANEETPGDSTTGTNQEAPTSGDIENLMHTDAAQSVLEMGYHPNIIRRAIRAIREINDHEDLTATSLMEKIFALEETDNSANSHQNVEPLQQSLASQSTPARSELPSVRATADNNTSRSQRPAEVNSAASSNASVTQAAARNDTPPVSTHSGGPEMTRDDMPSLSTHTGGPEMNRAQKKSQLLEQKKLKEENEKLKQQSICTKCRQNDVCIVFLPCGHLVTCETCAPTVRYCTVQACGKYIKGTVRTYLA